MDIYLKRAIMHIVDRQTGDPVYSQVELDLTTEYIRDYLTKNSKISDTSDKDRPLAGGL